MIGILVLIATVQLIKPLSDTVNTTLNSTALNCNSTSLGYVESATCIVIEYSLFYFIGIALSISIALIQRKKSIAGVVSAVFIFILVSVLINPLKDFIVYGRGINGLNCTGSITTAAHITCLFFDLWLFYFVVIAISSAITYISLKRVQQ